MNYIYLSSPYSHHDAEVREARFVAACRAAAKLIQEGLVIYSPIAHSHPIEVHGMKQIESSAFWKRQDVPMLRHASELLVLRLPGWEDSAGIKWEVEMANDLYLPVSYMDPIQETQHE